MGTLEIIRKPHIISENLLQQFSTIEKPIQHVALESCLLHTTLRDKTRLTYGGSRKTVLSRHKNCCAFCFRHEHILQYPLEIHHIDLHCEGGKTLEENLLPLCKECHRFAHIGVWTRTYLEELVLRSTVNNLTPIIETISENDFRKELYEAVHESVNWHDKMYRLLKLWRKVGYVEGVKPYLMLEFSAKVQWEISAILTTHGSAGETVQLRSSVVPLNRYIGLTLCENALSAAEALKNFDKSLARELRLGIAHSCGVHYRSIGYIDNALRVFNKYCKELQDEQERKRVIRDPSWLSYLLCAYGLDLIKRRAFKTPTSLTNKGHKILEYAGQTVENYCDNHAVADTMLRIAEGMIFVPGQVDRGLSVLQKAEKLVESDIPIVQVIFRKLLMEALARSGDSSGADKVYNEAIQMAEKHHLDDQHRKIVQRHIHLEKENLLR